MESITVTNCLVEGYQTILKHLEIIKVLVKKGLITDTEELSVLVKISPIMEEYEALFLLMKVQTPQLPEAILPSDIEHFLSVHFGETNAEIREYIISLF